MALNPKEYYRTIKGYHEIAESSHERPMIDPLLLRRFIPADAVVLDAGGGTGYNAEFLSIEPRNYYCVDLSPEGLRMMSEKNRGTGLIADAAELPCRDGSMDVILCSWSLEHFAQPAKVLDEFRRILRPGGRILIWGPNWDNIFRKDFPQFAHKSAFFIWWMRLRLFGRMIRNELFRSRYRPFVFKDVAAFVDPKRYISYDTDAVHCVLCQETVHYFSGWTILFLADYRDMLWFVNMSGFARGVRSVLRPVIPVLRKIPLLRWFVIRFPLIVEKPE